MQGFFKYYQVIESQSVPTFMMRIEEAAEDRTYGSQESGYQEIMPRGLALNAGGRTLDIGRIDDAFR